MVYFDNILIYSQSEEEHLSHFPLQQKRSIARTFCPRYILLNSEDKSLSSLNSSRRGKYCLESYSEDKSPHYRANVVAIVFAGNFTAYNFGTKCLRQNFSGKFSP